MSFWRRWKSILEQGYIFHSIIKTIPQCTQNFSEISNFALKAYSIFSSKKSLFFQIYVSKVKTFPKMGQIFKTIPQ